MSLINDVLRDLERRGAAPPARVSPSGASPARPARRLVWPWWLLSAVVVGILLHLAWRDFGVESSSLKLPATAAQSVADPEPSEQPAQQPTRAPPTFLTAQVVSPAATAPAISPATSDQAVPSETPDRAMVSVDQLALPAAPATETRRTNSTGARPGAAGTAPPVAAETSENPPEQAREPVIRIERAQHAAGADSESIIAARRALARGQTDLARHHLQAQLDRTPVDHEARLLLARVHDQSGHGSAAITLLEAGLNQPEPAPIAAALARMLLERGQDERARDLLLDHAPAMDAGANADYHLLLAAALRQTGQHDQALVLYRALSETRPHWGQVWIGLGSTLETLDQPQAARSAYQRALQADDPRAIAFARGRLAALPQDTESAR